MKTFIRLSLALILIPLLSACSSDLEDQARELLCSVPADSELVAVCNMEGMLDNLGIKQKDGAFQCPPALKGYVEKSGGTVSAEGVRPSVFVAFTRGSKVYVEGWLDDTEAYKGYLEKKTGGKFFDNKDVSLLEGKRGEWYAVYGDRFWYVSKGSADADEIKRYTSLSESNSILKNSYAEKLTALTHQVAGYGSISSLLSFSHADMKSDMVAGMVLNSIFSDASLVSFNGDFSKESVDFNLEVLTSKGDPARFTIPMRKIDAGMVAQTALTADMVVAAGLPENVFGMLTKSFGSLVDFSSMSGINGTLAFSAGMKGKSLSGAVQTNGGNVPSLVSLIGQFANVDTEVKDNVLTFKTASPVEGSLNVAKVAKRCSEAYVAVVMRADIKDELLKGFESISIMLKPAGGSARLTVSLNAPEGKTWLR